MQYENDFVDEKPVEFKVDGRIFVYKPVTGGDENSWLKDVMTIDVKTKKQTIDWGLYNLKKIANILKVPYEKELITKQIGVNKEWCDLIFDQKCEFLGKLNPKLFDKIMKTIREIDEPDEESTKN